RAGGGRGGGGPARRRGVGGGGEGGGGRARGVRGGGGGGGRASARGGGGGERRGGGPTRPACSRGSREGGGAPFSKGRNSGRSEDRSERARAERSRGVHQPRGQGREGWPPVLVHGARRRGRRPRTRWGRPRQGPR